MLEPYAYKFYNS